MLPFIQALGRTLPTYGVLVLLAGIFGGALCALRAPRQGVNREDAVFAWLLACVMGMLGGKMLYVLTALPYIFGGGWAALYAAGTNGGFVFYGGVLGGALAVVGYARRYKLALLPLLDLLAPGTALASAVGRLGCHAVGCCHGTVSLWGIRFANSPVAPNGVTLVPVQLMESGFCLLLSIGLCAFQRRPRPSGLSAGLYLCIYAVGRFVLEFWRGDVQRGFIGMFSTSQMIALLAFAAGAALVVKSRKEAARELS